MGVYRTYLFPLMVDWVLARPQIGELRRGLLADVKGKILEIGFGTGLNLPFYPESVQEISVVDPNPGMMRRAQRRVKESGRKLDLHMLKGEALPFEPERFDSVVSTFTLCSIPDLPRALKEIGRVLKPDGRFFFLEHGLSPDPRVQHWQRRLTPIQKVFGDGCHLDRNMEKLIGQADFHWVSFKKFYQKGLPKIGGYFYQGVASKRLESASK